MKTREFIAWLAVCAVVILAVVREHQHRAELLSTAEALYEAGETLEHQAERVDSLRDACGERARQIFECEQRICEVNGWYPPDDWDERTKDEKDRE